MKLRDDINEFGTPVTWFECEYCGREFWVCPAVEDDNLDYWRGCLWNECESYDPNRDVDALMFFEAIEIDKRDASTPARQSDGSAAGELEMVPVEPGDGEFARAMRWK